MPEESGSSHKTVLFSPSAAVAGVTPQYAVKRCPLLARHLLH